MFMPAVRLAIVVSAVLCAGSAFAGTLKVPSADFPTIQSAVDAAVSGDVISVAKGLYAENVLVGTGNITLQGKNAAIDGGYLGDCIRVAADDVTVSGFLLLNGGNSGVFAGAAGDGESTGALACIGAGALITKNEVRAAGGVGISLTGSGTVSHNTVSSCTGTGIEVHGQLLGEPPLTAISKNEVRYCSSGIFAFDSVCTIEKNTCTGNAQLGIALLLSIVAEAVPGVLPPGSLVTGNTCELNFNLGIAVSDPLGTGIVVEKNTCSRNGAGLVVVGTELQVTGNKISGNTGGGMGLFMASSSATKNLLTDNNAVGIVVEAAEPIFGLTAGDGVPPPSSGLNTVSDNIIKGSGGDGINVVSSPTSTFEHNTVTDSLGDGISIVAGGGNVDVQLLSNKCTGSQHDGIDNCGATTLISSNVVKGSGGNDLAGIGDTTGTVDLTSAGNSFASGGLDQPGLLELVTFVP